MRLLAKADPSTADEGARVGAAGRAGRRDDDTGRATCSAGGDIAESLVLEKGARARAGAARSWPRAVDVRDAGQGTPPRIEGRRQHARPPTPNAGAARRSRGAGDADRRRGVQEGDCFRCAQQSRRRATRPDGAPATPRSASFSAVRSGDVSSLAVDRPGSGGGERGAEVARPPRPVRDEQPAGEVAPLKAPATETTPAGQQTVIPGAEKAPDAKLAQIGADAPLKPRVPQKDTDGLPLINDSAKQGDLVDAIKAAPNTGARADAVKPPAEPQTKVGDQEPTLASQPSAEGAARDLWGDGRWKARVGDHVYQTVPGPFGMPASIRGTVEQGKGGLRVRVEAAGDAMGIGQYRGRSVLPYDSAWTVVDDPEPGRRRKEASDKEQAERDKFDAFIADELKKTADDVEAAVASGHARLTAENAKPGLVVINYSYGDHRGKRHYISEIGNDGTVYSSIFGVDDEVARSRGGYDTYSVPMPEQIVPLDEYGQERSKNHAGADAETGENISIRHMGKVSERDAMRNVRLATRAGQYRVVRTTHKPWSVDDFFGSTMEEAEANARKSAEQAADRPITPQVSGPVEGQPRPQDAAPPPAPDASSISWADAKPGDKTTEQDAPSKRLASKGEGLSLSVSVDAGDATFNYALHAPDINSKSPIMRRMWHVIHSPDKIKLPSDIKFSFFDSDIEAKSFIDRHAKAVSASGGKINYIDIENAKPGDVLFSGDTLVRSNIARKADAVDIAAKAPARPRAWRDRRRRWPLGRDGARGASPAPRHGRRAAPIWSSRDARPPKTARGRDDFPSDLGQDARTAWREGWDARAAAKNAETAAQKPPVTGLRFDPKASPADAVAAHLAKGEGFSTIVQARKFIDENGGKGLSLKQVDEAVEHGVVKVARQIVASDPAPLAVYDKLVNLYNRQPRLGRPHVGIGRAASLFDASAARLYRVARRRDRRDEDGLRAVGRQRNAADRRRPGQGQGQRTERRPRRRAAPAGLQGHAIRRLEAGHGAQRRGQTTP
jgi:hypothetical protein